MGCFLLHFVLAIVHHLGYTNVILGDWPVFHYGFRKKIFWGIGGLPLLVLEKFLML
jgi:hypothetical protein